jgi:gliding motility-associated lipoprotein GldD
MKIYRYLVLIILFLGCKEERFISPKPHMFPRISYPDRNYTEFSEPYCDLRFSYPDYAQIIQDTLFFDEKPLHPCWFDVYFEPFNGKLHCSYYPISNEKDFDELIKDAFTFVDKHDIKANYRAETAIKGRNNTGGLIFEIDGPVATPIQFFLTDSINHFIRGSLYFDNKVNPDSMAPVHVFVGEDVKQIISTLEFID